MSSPDYRSDAERERFQTRLQALGLAHDREAPPKDVVARAKEYIAFIESDK